MKTLLVPTDFSDSACNAADYAAGLAKYIGAKLVLFHAYMLPVPVSEIPYVMITGDELQKSNETAIKKEAERLFEKTGLEIEWVVRLGIPDDEIRDLATEKNADMIVMGMKGAGAINSLIGSTTDAVIRKFNKPVLAIPQEIRYRNISNITYASDFDFEMRLECLEPLLELLRLFHAKLRVLHIQKEGKKMTADENAGKSRLEAIWADLPHDYTIIANDKMEDAITNFIKEHDTDMLVLVAHQHNFLERFFGNHLTRELTGKVHIPLLVLQDKH